MVDERPQRVVAGEANAVEVVGLALVPACGAGEVDDRGCLAVLDHDGLAADVEPSGATSNARTSEPPAVA